MSPMLLGDDPRARSHGSLRFWQGFVVGLALGLFALEITLAVWHG